MRLGLRPSKSIENLVVPFPNDCSFAEPVGFGATREGSRFVGIKHGGGEPRPGTSPGTGGRGKQVMSTCSLNMLNPGSGFVLIKDCAAVCCTKAIKKNPETITEHVARQRACFGEELVISR